MARTLSTADDRREAVLDSAIAVFAASGYLGTPIASIAAHADISPAYVFKLFPGKESLFVAALERCFERIEWALEAGARTQGDGTPAEILDAMGQAYADLIADRSLLMLQVHAQSASDVPAIQAALRQGLARITRFVTERSGADGEAVQHFIAWGQLCHLIVTAGLDDIPDAWARALTKGIRHS
ncbi:TetR/AcrR family transcriptional regulator [Leifsonia xyli]|uniref:TetR/AcrR family transcriptional regulator n=1 Tax=Leifsonia xyli TaxID=1575 RepID=UPI003D66C67C